MIRISESTFSRLQKLATPFTDTPATVIDRLLDHWDISNAGQTDSQTNPVRNGPEADNEFSTSRPPDLHHAKLLFASIGDETVKNWNGLVALAHRQAIAAGCSYAELEKISLSHIRADSYTESGFKFHADIDISIQNVDANNAWKNSFHLAKHFNLPIAVEFQWRNKEGAAYPGRIGNLSWKPIVTR